MPEHPGESPPPPEVWCPSEQRQVPPALRWRTIDSAYVIPPDLPPDAVRLVPAPGAGTAAPAGEDDEVRCECGHVDTDHDANPETGWGSCQACLCEGFQQAEEAAARAPREAPADTARAVEESRLRAEVAAHSGPSSVEGERWITEQYRQALARALGAEPGLSMVSLIQAAAARTASGEGSP